MNINNFLNLKLKNLNLSGKIFIITGANSGIGFELAKLVASYNGKVVFACRNKKKVDDAISQILKKYPTFEYDFLYFNQSSIKDIKIFIINMLENYPNFESLILNAGILKSSKYDKTEDGFYSVNGVNFINLVYLIEELKKQILLTNNTFNHRIIFQGSCMVMFSNYKYGKLSLSNSKGFSSYNISKLGEESLFYSLIKTNNNNRLKYALAEPGACKSNIYHNMPKFLLPIADLFMTIFFHSTLKGSLSAFLLAVNYKDAIILRPRGFLSLSGYPKIGKIRMKVKKHYQEILKEAYQLLNIF